MFNGIKNKLGLFLLFFSLTVQFLITLPLCTSVICANENQGFAFIWGQTFLKWGELSPGRGLLFVLLYSLVLKIFGFNTYSIIAIHILELVFRLVSGLLIYFISMRVTKNGFWSGFAVLIWVILFSLLSIFFMLAGGFFDSEKKTNKQACVLSGIFAFCSLMSKANGSILLLASVFWILLLAIFNRAYLKLIIEKIKCYFTGVILSALVFNLLLFIIQKDLSSHWKDYFLVGSYTSSHLQSIPLLVESVFNFITRKTTSLNNLILFSISVFLFLIGIFSKKRENLFGAFVSIWGIGNICVIVIPGEYQPYYYYLIWTQIAFIFSLSFFLLFNSFKIHKIIKTIPLIFILFIFAHRVILWIPAHLHILNTLKILDISSQKKSFIDPIKQTSMQKVFRPPLLEMGDTINSLLPNKDSTVYILNLHEKGDTAFTPLSYIYSKRYSVTSIDSGLLQINNVLSSKVKTLKSDLIKRHPNMLIVSQKYFISGELTEILNPFLQWFNNYVKQYYRFYITIQCNLSGKTEFFDVYERIMKK